VKREWLIAAALVVITLAVFAQAKDFAFVRYDDDKYVTQNPPVQKGLTMEGVRWAFTSLAASNWHPVTWLSHMLDSSLYGPHPRGHHITNVLLHLLNTLLLFAVFRKMSGAVWQSAFVAALFAVHPLHVESVAWVAERKDVLSAFFFLLTLWAYIRYVRLPGWSRYAPVLIFFALGLMSKPMLVTLPFVLLLLDVWPLRRLAGEPLETAAGAQQIETAGPGFYGGLIGLCREKIPLFILSAFSIGATLLAQRQEITPLDELPLAARTANALVSYLVYIGKMFWPQALAVLYPYPDANPLWQAAAAGAILTTAVLLVVKYGRRFPYLAVGWFWYLGTLVPVVGIVQVGAQSHADRYTYLPLIGLFIMIAWGIPELLKGRSYGAPVLGVLAGIVVAACAVLSWQQLAHWQNSLTLFEHTLAVTKNNYVIRSNMGAALAEEGRFAEAVVHYEEALRIRPKDVDIRYNYANALARQGKMREAVVQYEIVLKTEPGKAAVHNNLAIALASIGQTDKALGHWREALRLKPDYEEAQVNLRMALERLKKPQAIEDKAASAQGIDADTADGQMRLGIGQLQKGTVDGAVAHFEEALKRNPRLTEAHLSLGIIMAKKQNLDAAIRHFQEALKINPQFAKAHNSLAVILAQKGRTEEAVTHLREALRINPDYEDAKRNLRILTNSK